jgi:hypothetical protein
MRYWWVNQNQTFRQEIAGGYLWSPKRNANGGRNPFYESMREVAPGDLILSQTDRVWFPLLGGLHGIISSIKAFMDSMSPLESEVQSSMVSASRHFTRRVKFSTQSESA